MIQSELVTPQAFRDFSIEYEINEVEKTSAQIIIDNITRMYNNVGKIEFLFDFNIDVETYDGFVFCIYVGEVRFNNHVVKFDNDVAITVSNNSTRKLMPTHSKVVYDSKFDLFRNEEGMMIKYYPYTFE